MPKQIYKYVCPLCKAIIKEDILKVIPNNENTRCLDESNVVVVCPNCQGNFLIWEIEPKP